MTIIKIGETVQAASVIKLEPLFEVRVITENSLWLVRPDTYIRMPREEYHRPETLCLDNALIDNEWHEHQGCWLIDSVGHGAWILRILPSGRPEGSYGILSGSIEVVWETLP